MLENKHSACVTVYNPRRLIHHLSNSKFELKKYVVVAKPKDAKEVVLKTCEATFSETPVHIPVTLPPQIEETSGVVRVGAEYGDGLVVYSKTDLVEDWPHYGEND